jgi:beta-glucosidase
MKQYKIITVIILTAFMLMPTGCMEKKKINPFGIAGKTHAAVIPVEQTWPLAVGWWKPRHEEIIKRNAQGNVNLIMIGDSITHGWENQGRELWNEYYAPRGAVNMGFGGDRTEHVLWRLDHGELDGINPNLAVVMIGTNNSNDNDYTAEEIADGIKAICHRIRMKLPDTKILLLAIFPRGDGNQMSDKTLQGAYNQQWAKNDEASRLASCVADNRHIFYLNINDAFLNEDNALPRDVMPDLLHPHEKGYKIWAEAMEPTVKKLMGEK